MRQTIAYRLPYSVAAHQLRLRQFGFWFALQVAWQWDPLPTALWKLWVAHRTNRFERAMRHWGAFR